MGRIVKRIMELNIRVLRIWLQNLGEWFMWLISLYSEVLALATRSLRQLGVPGDVMLTPLALAWMLWPLHVPIHLAHHHLFFTAVPFSLFLCAHGKRVVEINWRSS